MRLRAVAWDVDGTLADSEPLHHRALLAGTASWGVDVSDLPDQAFRGVHMSDVWRALRERLPKTLAQDEWLGAIVAHYIENRTEVAGLPGAVATVRALAERGIPQVCVSNSGRSIVNANLDALGIAEHMRFVISFDDVSAGKPDPEPYLKACAGLELPPAAVLAVEDSFAGATSACRAGLPVALCAELAQPLPWPTIDAADLTTILALFP